MTFRRQRMLAAQAWKRYALAHHKVRKDDQNNPEDLPGYYPDFDPNDIDELLTDSIRHEWETQVKRTSGKIKRGFMSGVEKGIGDMASSDVPVTPASETADTESAAPESIPEDLTPSLETVPVTTDIDVGEQRLINSFNEVANNWADEHAADMVGMKWVDGELVENPNPAYDITETTRKELRGIVAAAFEDNTPIQDVVEQIKNAGAFSDSRAETIARTEVQNAQIQGNWAVWEQSGVTHVTWLTSDDPNVCIWCEMNDGKTVEFGDIFPSGDIMPTAHPNCQCVLAVAGLDTSDFEAVARIGWVFKFNENHDELGRFSSGDGDAAGMTAWDEAAQERKDFGIPLKEMDQPLKDGWIDTEQNFLPKGIHSHDAAVTRYGLAGTDQPIGYVENAIADGNIRVAAGAGFLGLEGRKDDPKILETMRDAIVRAPAGTNLINITLFDRESISRFNDVEAADKWLASGAKDDHLKGISREDFIKYSEDQPRDDHGRWTDAGGAAGGSLAPGQTTEQAWKKNDTEWKPERIPVHERIINSELQGKHAAEGQPTATILGGGTAVGKSSLVQAEIVKTSPDTVNINADHTMHQLPEFEQLRAQDPQHLASRLNGEASFLARATLARAAANKFNVLYDGTASQPVIPDMVRSLHENGYRTDVVFADVPIDVAKQRAIERANIGTGVDAGRRVPESVIEANHRGSAANFLKMKDDPTVDSVRLYDTSKRPVELIYTRIGSNPGIIYDPAKWNAYLRKAREAAKAALAPGEWLHDVGHDAFFNEDDLKEFERLLQIEEEKAKQHPLGKYSEDQPRDEQGRWTDGGGAGAGAHPSDTLRWTGGSQTGHWTENNPGNQASPKPSAEAMAPAKPVAGTSAEHVAHLATTPIKATSDLNGGTSVTKIVEFSDGTKGVFKPASGERADLRGNITDGYQTEREVAAWEVARIVGMDDLVTPVTVREIDGVSGALSEWKNGTIAMDVSPHDKAFDGPQDASRAAAFDYVIGNEDRHAGNWLVEGDKLHLIDHSLAFPDKVSANNPGATYRTFNDDFIERAAQKLTTVPADFAAPYDAAWPDISNRLGEIGLSKRAIDGVRARITILGNTDKWEKLRFTV